MVTSIPQYVVDRAKLLSTVHPSRTVSDLTGLSCSTLWHLRRRGWKAAPSRNRPMPSDFQIQARHMTRNEMARHYRASNTAVSRWLRELRGRQ